MVCNVYIYIYIYIYRYFTAPQRVLELAEFCEKITEQCQLSRLSEDELTGLLKVAFVNLNNPMLMITTS